MVWMRILGGGGGVCLAEGGDWTVVATNVHKVVLRASPTVGLRTR